jgi:hypothetical protein
MNAIEMWRDSVPEGSRLETGAGAALLGAGIAAGILMATRRRRGFFAWAIPGAILAAAIVMLTDVVLDVRSERIEEAEEAIEGELAGLDPVARAQVLRSIGERQIQAFMPGGD